MQIPHAAPGKKCPFNGKPVEKVCHECPMWVSVRGKHPQSGEDIDEWVCSFAITPMLLIETARQSRSAAAATENLRNEVAQANSRDRSAELTACLAVMGQKLTDALPNSSEQKLISG